ncbi:LysR family transcriptional regulator [Phenylobacterium soli]|uniref:LysR family transcriptional regulator n=1 Tax=Phenylobacterium soli TaxID=2170551 RepID=UPI00361465E6
MDVQERTVSAEIDWDDVRVFLAVARAGSFSGAARELGVNHTTVGRRLTSLEAALGGHLLLERRPDGYVLTPAGAAAASEAERMDLASHALRRAVEVGEELAGPVRISSLASFGERILAAPLAALAAAHPSLRLELVGEDRNVQLSKGEADIAIRFGRPADDEALTRQIGEVGYRLYAAPGYLAATPAQTRRFVGFSDDMARIAPGAARLRELMGGQPPTLRCGAFAAQAAAAAAGAGIAMLPLYLGEGAPGLVRVDPAADRVWSQPIWLVVRADVRRVARVRRVADVLAEAVETRAADLRG